MLQLLIYQHRHCVNSDWAARGVFLLSVHSRQVRFRGRCAARTCGRAAGGQVSRTEWWPSLADRDWQEPDGGGAARIMLNYFWHGAARKLKAQGGECYPTVLGWMKEPDQQPSQIFYWNKSLAQPTSTCQECRAISTHTHIWVYAAKTTRAVQHVNCSHLGLICFDLLFAFLSRIVTFGWSAFV